LGNRHCHSSFHLHIDTEKNCFDSDESGASSGLLHCQTDKGKPLVGANVDPKQLNSRTTKVVYVDPPNAKALKNYLQEKGWLDKKYRMTKVVAQSDGVGAPCGDVVPIALPILLHEGDVSVLLADEFCKHIILSHGEMDMPFSTSQYAAGGNKRLV
jgi:hypothetical protein